MNWSDVGNIIGKSAPMLGSLLGGPGGAAMGAMVANLLGTEKDPDAVNAALIANPDYLVRLKEAELNTQLELQKLTVTAANNQLQASGAQYLAEAADRDSARQLAAKQPSDIVRPTVTLFVLGGSLFVVVAIVMGWATDAIANTNAALTVGTVLGLWFGMTKEVMGFWFGMTKESQKQSAIITDFAVAPGEVKKPDPLTPQVGNKS